MAELPAEALMSEEDFGRFRETLSGLIPGLFLSGVPASYAGFPVVVSCELYQRKRLLGSIDEGSLFLHVPFEDGDARGLPLGSFDTVAEAVERSLARMERVLVHCTAGLNRGALVAAWVLVRGGFVPSAEDAVSLIRARRSEWCLCNADFLDLLLTERLSPLPYLV
jgi:protein-tyrosine phosphatase